MKKSLSIILAVIMLLPMIQIVFATENDEIYFYSEPNIQQVVTPVYWEKGEDWNIEQNLLYGVQPQIMTDKDYKEEADYKYNTLGDYTMLTDGVYSPNLNVYNGMYFNTYRSGTRRTLFFDIGYLSALKEIKVSFLSRTSWGVKPPELVYVTFSEDGYNWYDVGTIIISGEDNSNIQSSLCLADSLKTRFVALRYTNSSAFACLDEIEANGTKNESNALHLSQTGIRSYHIFKNKVENPTDEILCGTKNMMLAYHSRYFDWTEEYFAPYVAHLDENGNADDVFFDGFCFLLSGSFPYSQLKGDKATNMKDWQWELDKLFGDDINISALDSATENVKTQLDLPDYKCKFFVSIYLPDQGQTDFGDVDNDGVSECFSDIEDRIKAVKWYIDDFYSRLSETSYDNVEFGGLYWYDETMKDTTEVKTMMCEISDYIHQKGTQFFWIPYLTAGGHTCYESYGFDYAYLQPNYYFYTDATKGDLYRAINQAEKYGMGVEYELDDNILTDTENYLPRYMQYLKKISGSNISTSIRAYYQGVSALYNIYHSDNPLMRMVYDYTYQMSKNSLELTPQVINGSESCNINTILNSKLSADNDYPADFAIVSQPENGTLELNADGTYTYTPDENYYGSDSFTYTYNHYLNNSDTCTVTINVECTHSKTATINAVSPTCTSEGKSADSVCLICGEILEYGKIIDAIGHKEIVFLEMAAPTCTQTGHTAETRYSECGIVIKGSVEISAKGHTDSNKDNVCDDCGTTLTTSEPSKNCPCNCHKSGFMGFIYKLQRLFWKMFKTHQTCECGVAHY